MQVAGTRVGAALIGTWMLEVSYDSGDRRQRLRVNADMSGLYGATPVKEIKFEDDKVSFKVVREFRDQTFEMDFVGKLTEGKLTGELTSDRGSQQVTGTKVTRNSSRRSAG